MSRAKIDRHRGTCATCGQENICHTGLGEPYSRHLRAAHHKAAAARESIGAPADDAEPATVADMPPKSPIQAVPATTGLYKLVRPGARYAVRRSGEEHVGAWLPDGEPWPVDCVFVENEARALLPLLRALEGRAAGKGGRIAGEATTPDGKLIARACKKLGLTVVALAEAIGAHESVLSRARSGELPAKHSDAIKALIKGKSKRAS